MNTNSWLRCAAVPLLMILCLGPVSGQADDLAEKGRSIFEKHQRIVVTIQVVQRMRLTLPGLGGQANETKQDITGTVIDPSGLTVTALSSCEPGDVLQNLMGGLTDDDTKMKMQTELGEIKILLDDGTEVPADIVLRDKDLDLAFLRPKAKLAEPVPSIDLKESGSAQVLDQVITLNRLGRAVGRSYAASVERINAIVRKPRLFYVPGSDPSSTAVGSPAFNLDGKLIGIFVTRSLSNKGAGGLSMLSSRQDSLAVILLPTEAIRKAAEQVPESKPDEAKGDKS